MKGMRQSFDLRNINDKKILNALVHNKGNINDALAMLFDSRSSLDYFEKNKYS